MSIITDFIFEVVFEFILESWIYLMQLIIPEKSISLKLEKILRILVVLISIALFILMIVGIGMLTVENKLGKPLFFIPFAISIIQIIVGMTARAVNKKKK